MARSASEAKAIVAEIAEAGRRAHAIEGDLSASDGPHTLARKIRAIVGERLNILVVSAGIARAAEFEETGIEDFDELFAVNTTTRLTHRNTS